MAASAMKHARKSEDGLSMASSLLCGGLRGGLAERVLRVSSFESFLERVRRKREQKRVSSRYKYPIEAPQPSLEEQDELDGEGDQSASHFTSRGKKEGERLYCACTRYSHLVYSFRRSPERVRRSAEQVVKWEEGKVEREFVFSS